MRNPFVRVGRGAKYVIRSLRGFFHSKYVELILAVGLFVLLDTGVLILNFYTSYQIANDAHAIQLASKMGVLSQRMFNELFQVEDDLLVEGADYSATIDVLAATYKVFDETLDAFLYGGDLIGVGQGQDSLLEDTTYRDTSANVLKDAEKIWTVYRKKLDPIVYSYFNDIDQKELLADAKDAIAYGRENNKKLLDLMESFGVAVEGVAQRKAARLRKIQSVGISLAVVNFFIILFHFLRRLRQSDELVEKARKETEDILKNVNEGLFLLDKNYVIGSQHSDSLDSYFNNTGPAGKNFIDLLRPFVTEKTLHNVEDYTEILFSDRVNESLITDLNPLKEVEMNMSMETGRFESRFLSFQFSRVYEKNNFHELLVTVKDITELVNLTEQLQRANDKASQELATLLAIIHVDSVMLQEFLQTTALGLNRVNDILKRQVGRRETLKDKLEEIFRIIHKLKGDSTTLGLQFIVEKFHGFECAITKLKEQYSLIGEDFLPLVVHLNRLVSDFALVRDLQSKINSLQGDGFKPFPPLSGRQPSTLCKQLKTLVAQVARDCHKQVILDMDKFDVSLLAEEQREAVKDIVVQSLRNAITHGIEAPNLRTSLGKPMAGKLSVMLSRNGESLLQLVVRDDGQGIDLEKIRSKAIAQGLATAKQIAGWQRTQLLSLLFRQGFSTSERVGLHAGQGVGLDLIKIRLGEINGKVKIRFKQGQYTEFLFDLQEDVNVAELV